MRRTIAVVTGTRAEYGILKPLLYQIDKSKKTKLELLVTGMHLVNKYGKTIKEIESDGFSNIHVVNMYTNEKMKTYHAKSLGRAIANFAQALNKIRPDFLVVLGDRLEALAATISALTLNIPIAHIHGGDKTDSGHIDESIRHAISQFAHIHFPATKEHALRLKVMGQQKWRIHKVGALALDSILLLDRISKRKLFTKYGLDMEKKLVICLFHPVQLEVYTIGKQMKCILRSLENSILQTVIIYPNNDMGSDKIIGEIEKYRNAEFFKVVKNIPHNTYLNLLEHASLLIGNSSSGIIESPSFKLPAINVGTRNTGRIHGTNVLFVEAKKDDIIKAIKTALYNTKFKNKVQRCKNPYDNGKTSQKILEVLTSIKINEKLLRKNVII